MSAKRDADQSRTPVVFIDRFSAGLDELTRKEQASVVEVLRVLKRTGRFSVFEATDNDTIARTMDFIVKQKLVEINPNEDAYPWSRVTLTARGEEAIEQAAETSQVIDAQTWSVLSDDTPAIEAAPEKVETSADSDGGMGDRP